MFYFKKIKEVGEKVSDIFNFVNTVPYYFLLAISVAYRDQAGR